ncbi:uncharacterized protein KZ484_020970 isoform 1-T2 [Pholidichthys leucotaenia]
MDPENDNKRAASSPSRNPLEHKKKRQDLTREIKQECGRRRGKKTRINIGGAFEPWRELRIRLGIRSDTELAFLLLNRYHNRDAKYEGPIGEESDTSGDTEESAEDQAVEQSSINKAPARSALVDEEHIKNFACSAPTVTMATLPLIKQEDCGREIDDYRDVKEPAADSSEEEDEEGLPYLPDPLRVLAEDDLVDQSACITYHSSLIQLASYLQLPFKKCYYLHHESGIHCDGVAPFQVKIQPRGTAAVVEWSCKHGHKLWKWNSQPVLKYGMQGGDFMLSMNVLLSGSNLSKVGLLFRFMNMGMVAFSTYYSVQDSYCIDAIKEFWEENKTKNSAAALANRKVDSSDPDEGSYQEDDDNVDQSDDIWQAANDLTTKLHEAGMVSGQSDILVWIKDIINHFWACCQKADDLDSFFVVWRGILHHVCGQHEWAEGKCEHGAEEELCGEDFMVWGSPAHDVLSEIILNKHWLKDVENSLTFRSPSDRESLQSHISMYTGKESAFSPAVHEARTLLAALDYNHHIHRPVHINQRGEVSQKRVYNKKSNRYKVLTMKVAKDYSYIPFLQRRALAKRLKSATGLPRRRTQRADEQ